LGEVRVPVTARLSKLFYERLGEQIANELVDWFNLVDATYKADLRELNDLNFARLEQRMTALETRMDLRLTAIEARFDAKLETSIAGLKEWMERRLGEQTRFFFLAWAILLASNIALWFR
jgi:hypothetical protein